MRRQGRCLASLVIAAAALPLLQAGVNARTVTITFQYRGGGARTETAMAWIEEFQKLYPNIKVEFAPVTDNLGQRTAVAWASGTGPDVTEMWGDDAQALARSGALLDLRAFVRRDFTRDDINDFFPVAWDASFLKYGPNAGIQFRIPRYIITTVFYYNQDAFAQAGLATPLELDRSNGWTWQALREMARKLTVTNGNQVQRWGFSTQTGDYRRLVVWARAGGGDFFNPTDPTDFVGDGPGAVAGLAFLQDLIWKDRSTAPTFLSAQFSTGQVALLEEGNHAVLARYDREIKDTFAWNLAPRPIGPNGRKSYTGDDGFVIWKETKYPEEAWTFVKFLTSKRGMEIAAKYEGLAPVRRSALPFYLGLSNRLNLGALVTNMADAGLPISSYMVGDVRAVAEQLNAMLTATLQRNEKPYEVAAREVAPTLEAILKQSRGR